MQKQLKGKRRLYKRLSFQIFLRLVATTGLLSKALQVIWCRGFHLPQCNWCYSWCSGFPHGLRLRFPLVKKYLLRLCPLLSAFLDLFWQPCPVFLHYPPLFFCRLLCPWSSLTAWSMPAPTFARRLAQSFSRSCLLARALSFCLYTNNFLFAEASGINQILFFKFRF